MADSSTYRNQEDWRSLYLAVSGQLTPGRELLSLRQSSGHWRVRWADRTTGNEVQRTAEVPFDEWPNPDSADGCGLIRFCEEWLKLRGFA